MSNSRIYICMWDCNGFEVIEDLTRWENESFLNSISGKELSKPPVNLRLLKLRAHVNPHRNYEIWTFNTTSDINKDDLWMIANENPQSLVDLIREKGKNLYKAALSTTPKII